MNSNNTSKDTRPLMVSILCITYNHEPYIRQCLEGFVMQKTNFRFEAIVHDDASTDGTADIIREYAEKYPDIIKPILETENQYSKHDGSLDRIMEEACKGKYIALCEGDDYWTDPNKLQIQVDFLENHPDYSMTCCRTKRFSQRRKVFVSDVSCKEKDGDLSPQNIIEKGGLYIATCSILYRREVTENYPQYCRNCHVGDYPLQIMCAMKGKVWFFNNVMAVYRVDNSLSWTGLSSCNNSLTIDKLYGLISEVRMLQGFKVEYPSFYRSFSKQITTFIIWSSPIKIFDKMGYDMHKKAFYEEIKRFEIKDRLIYRIIRSGYYDTLLFRKICKNMRLESFLLSSCG